MEIIVTVKIEPEEGIRMMSAVAKEIGSLDPGLAAKLGAAFISAVTPAVTEAMVKAAADAGPIFWQNLFKTTLPFGQAKGPGQS